MAISTVLALHARYELRVGFCSPWALVAIRTTTVTTTGHTTSLSHNSSCQSAAAYIQSSGSVASRLSTILVDLCQRDACFKPGSLAGFLENAQR